MTSHSETLIRVLNNPDKDNPHPNLEQLQVLSLITQELQDFGFSTTQAVLQPLQNIFAQVEFFRPVNQVEKRVITEEYDFNNEHYILRLTLDAENASGVAYRLSVIHPNMATMVRQRKSTYRKAGLARPNDILREGEVACIAGVCNFSNGTVGRNDWHSQPHDFGPVVYKGVAPSLFNVSDILIREIFMTHSPATSSIQISGCDTAFDIDTVPISWSVKTGKTGEAYRKLGYQSVDEAGTSFEKVMKLT